MAEIKLPTRDELESKYNITNAPAKRESLQPVVKGPVTRKKKSLGKRLAEMFIGKDVEDIKEYILFTAVIPTIQNIICDIPQLIFFGRPSPRSIYGQPIDPRQNYTNYSRLSFTQDPKPRTDMYGRPVSDRKNYMFDDPVFRTYAEAEIIRSHMVDLVQQYGYVTVAQLNELMNIKSQNFTDYDWGWRSLAACDIMQIREGYLLSLPKVIYLK